MVEKCTDVLQTEANSKDTIQDEIEVSINKPPIPGSNSFDKNKKILINQISENPNIEDSQETSVSLLAFEHSYSRPILTGYNENTGLTGIQENNVNILNEDEIIFAENHEEIQNDTEEPIHSRKRKRDENKWKKNVRKRLRNSGQEYLSVKGTTVREKEFRFFECKCNFKCKTNFLPEKREEIHKYFYNLKDWKLQTMYIQSHVKVGENLPLIVLRGETSRAASYPDPPDMTSLGTCRGQHVLIKKNNSPVYKDTNLDEWFENHVSEPLSKKLEEFQERDSGWALKAVVNLGVNINKYTPQLGSSYIELPPQIKRKKACVIVKNDDETYFAWSVISALNPVDKDPQKLEAHTKDCVRINETAIKMTEESNKMLKFKNFRNKIKAPFAVYADLESALKRTGDPKKPQRTYSSSSWVLL
ncbi:unnamed protein product [Diabrotica balteata]|uniref:Uncharacterized protein n=1 Tax=Diabrotica balteata TaxID=107213 RepID=A0A9N9TFU1_DIABA|nr:unnamed protein product [Diabrotica balteata]